jgi:transposase
VNRSATKISFPLDIPDVDVLKSQQTAKGAFIITVRSRQETMPCRVCGQEIACNYGVGQAVQLRHLSILGLKTYVVLAPKRAQCPSCKHKPTTTQVLPWYEPRSPHTKAYDKHLMKQLVGSTVMDVSLKENLGYDAVLGALDRQLDKEVDWAQIQNVGTIGLDEIAHRKGHKNYRAVVTARQDDGTTRILAVLPDRKKRRSPRS